VAEDKGLKQSLNSFDAAMIVSGAIIGSGIFMNPAESAKFVQTSSQLLLVWAIGGVIAFLGGLCFAELGTMFPQIGGQYVYLEEAFVPWLGFLFGWTLFSTIQTGAIAAVSSTCARFVSFFLPMKDIWVSARAAGIIWLLSLVNILGIRPGSLVQNIFTSLKIAALLGLIGIGLFWFKSPQSGLGPLFPTGIELKTLSLLGLALMPALFSYGGWQNLNFVDWIFFALTGLAHLVLRQKKPDLIRPYRVWGYPVVPVVFFLISSAVVINIVISSPLKSLSGAAIILAGLPVYYLSRRKEPKNEVQTS